MIAPPLKIYVLSDSSGETASHVIHAALVQFPPENVRVLRLPQIKSVEQLISRLDQVEKINSLVAFTFVLPEFREVVATEALRRGLPTLDLLSPVISKLEELTQTTPLRQPGRLHLLDDAYYQRIEAVNFAVHFDDGKDQTRMARADVILLGVSRTSKTPNCMYLAQHYGIKAANVPIVPNVEPPKILHEIQSKKIVGLTIDPHILHNLRLSRSRILGLGIEAAYSQLDDIIEEVKFARRIFRDLGCKVIDVSSRAIEETSVEIYLYLQSQEGGPYAENT